MTKQKCGGLDMMVSSKIKKSGDFGGLYNGRTNESFMYVWEKDPYLGQKCVLSNCFIANRTNVRNKEFLFMMIIR